MAGKPMKTLYEGFEEELRETIPLLPIVQPREIPGAFENLTTHYVGPAVSTLLSYGPKFAPKGMQNRYADMLELLAHLLEILVGARGSMHAQYYRMLLEGYETDLNRYVAGADDAVHVEIRRMVTEAKRYFADRPSLLIVQSDKSKSTIVMERQAYDQRMDALVDKYLSDGVYVRMEGTEMKWFKGVCAAYKSIMARLDQEINEIMLNDVHNKEGHTLRMYFNQMASAQPALDHPRTYLPYLYGTVKSHKEDKPMRPVCSTLHWLSRPVQKLLTYCLKQTYRPYLLPNNVYDVTHFVRDINRLPVCDGYEFLKVDLNDMYTRIDKSQLQRTLQLWSISPNFVNRSPVSSHLFQQMLQFSLNTSCYVTYKGQVFKQAHGLPQGACDSSLLSCIYVDYLLSTQDEFLMGAYGIVYWYKYVDDFIFYIPSRSIDDFLRNFSIALGMELSIEREEPLGGNLRSISFLDVELIRSNNRLYTGLYVKPMASKRTLHYLSNHPASQKLNNARSLVRKCLHRSSNELLIRDLKYMVTVLEVNGYPLLYVAKVMRIEICDQVSLLRHGICSLPGQNVQERLQIVYSFLQSFSYMVHVPSVSECTHKKRERCFPSVVSPIHSIPFRDDALSKVISRMLRSQGLPSLVPNVRANQLYNIFKMSLKDNNPTDRVGAHSPAGRNHIYLVPCEQCNFAYLLYGTKEPLSLLSDQVQKEGTPLNQHLSLYNHTVSGRMLRLTQLGELSLGTRLSLYKCLYSLLGFDCTSKSVLDSIPRAMASYVKQLIDNMSAKELENFTYEKNPKKRRYVEIC